MSKVKAKPLSAPLHELPVGVLADFFALLTEKTRHTTRDGKPFLTCRFQDARRAATCAVWADSPLYAECEAEWRVGGSYKIRGTFAEHEKYGPQIEILQLRPTRPEDAADGYREAELLDRSRYDSETMFVELRQLVTDSIADEPLRRLTVGLLDAHAEVLKRLPATERRFYPFPGGWLEHVLNVTRTCIDLAERYAKHYPDLKPPLNRDVIVAGAALHDIGRAVELVPGVGGAAPEVSVPGRLFGHIQLGRDLIRDAARDTPDLHAELLTLVEHLVLSHLTLPEWGSPRLPAVPEVLILHHADDLDAKLEMYARCLTRDTAPGPFTERDPNLGKPLWKGRTV